MPEKIAIKPTVGRVLHFHPHSNSDYARIGDQPLAAMIAGVWTDTCVNLVVFDANGVAHNETSVLLFQDDGTTERPLAGYAEWMQYQKGQAAKTEQLQKALSGDQEPQQSSGNAA